MRLISTIILLISMSFTIEASASCDSTASLGSISDVCLNSDTFSISGANPGGGYFYGTGILDSSGSFLASIPGVGQTTVSYVYTDSLGCSDTASQSINVNALPNISLTAYDTLCLNHPVTSLNAGSSSSTGFGVYTGSGVSGTNQFNPSIAGSGLTAITFSFTDSATTCSNDTSSNIYVESLPTVSFSAIADLCFGNDTSILSGGSPAGGDYYGEGVLPDSLNYLPDSAGIFSLTYHYVDNSTGCFNTASQNLRVRSLPNVTLNNLSALCLNDSSVQLNSGSPLGGDYWGNGITDSSGTFSPSNADTGTHVIYYRYTDGFGCAAVDSTNITVNNLPTVSLSSLGGICANASPLSLTQGSSTATGAGVYSGMGVLSGVFYPSMVGVGFNNISYTFTESSTSCSNTITDSIEVFSIPTINSVTQDNYCENDEPDTLNFLQPSGGKFYGTGVLTDSLRFDADVSGLGVFNINYLYTDSNSCSNTRAFSVVVNAKPNPTVASQLDYCASDTAFTITGQSPVGGSFSGTGITGSGTQFSPVSAGAGLWSLTYTYTNSNSCTDSTSFDIKVNAEPVLTFSAIPDYCEDAGQQDLSLLVSADSSGTGVFSGQGMLNDDIFSPNQVGGGTYNLQYLYTDLNSCQVDTQISISVFDKPNLALSPFSNYCIDAGIDTLDQANIAGGRYFGNGISSDSIFDPSAAGVGIHTISFTYTNSNSCSDTVSRDIEVFGQPSVSFSLPASVCENGFPRNLSGSPTGGTFSGSGVFNSVFYPDSVSPGNYDIVYQYTDTNTCTSADTNTITVRSAPNVSISSIPDVCYDQGQLNLNQGSPAGGVYNLKGAAGAFSGNTLDLYTVGSGTYQVIYYYVSANLCVDTAKGTITIDPQPNVGLSLRSSVCENNGALNLNGGSPAGGTYFGNAVNGSSFDPVVAGQGSHNISYTYTDSKGCKDTASSSIQVDPAPSVSLGSIPVLCENSQAISLSQGSPAGGSYSGVPGIIAGNLYPNLAGAGNFSLNYSFTNSFGCSNSDTSIVVINAKPSVNIASQWTSCAGKDSVLLTGGTPSGGRYLGNFIDTNGFFYPDSSGVGAFPVSYEYTDTNQCSNSATQLMIVNPLPFVGFSALSDKCVNDAPFFITGGFPFGAGGRYRGNAVDSAGIFTPQSAGVGRDTVWYIFTDANSCSDSTYQEINVFGLPQLNAQAIPDICAESDPINLNYVSPGGGSYSGLGVVGSQFFSTIADTGIHQINYQYTDSNSCVSDTSLFIQVNGLPDSRVSPDTSVCKNTELELFVRGGAAYRWEDGSEESEIDVIVDSDQSFRVTVTSADNCERVHDIEVFLFDTLNIRSNVSIADCGENNASVSLNVSGGQFPYRFEWNTGEESSNLSNLRSGIYVVTISDQNLCEEKRVISINDRNAPQINLDSIVSPSCYGREDGYLKVSALNAVSFKWSNFKTGPELSGLPAGSYLVETIDSNNCRSFERFELNQDTEIKLDFDLYQPGCGQSDGSVIVNAEGGQASYTYVWNTGSQSDTLSSIGSGRYSITVTDQANCVETEELSLSDWGAPSVSLDSLLDPDCGQNNGVISITLLDTIPSTISWSNSSNSSLISGLAAGNYTLSVTDQNNCRLVRSYDLQTSAPDAPEICLLSSDTANNLNTIYWDVSAGGISTWEVYRNSILNLSPDHLASLNSSVQSFTDTLFGEVHRSTSYLLKSTNNCFVESDYSAPHKSVFLRAEKDRNDFVKLNWNSYLGRTVDNYYIYRFRTSVGLELIDSVPGSVLNYTDLNSFRESQDYHYFIAYRLAGNCGAQNQGFSNLSQNFAIPGLGFIEKAQAEWEIFPNPSNGRFNIDFNSPELWDVRIKIINLQGAVVFDRSLDSENDSRMNFDFTELDAGTYLIQLKYNDLDWSFKRFVVN